MSVVEAVFASGRLWPQFFFTLGLRLLNRLIPDLPFPLATPLTVTPGCCSTLSSVVFLMAAGEMRSWSAKNCSSLCGQQKTD